MQVRVTTTGRRSGEPREVTLYAYPDGDDLVIVGSWGGNARDPAWVGNLRAEPRATVRIGREDRPMRARQINGAERERLWELGCTAFPMYRTYQRRTERTIPLFVLATEGED